MSEMTDWTIWMVALLALFFLRMNDQGKIMVLELQNETLTQLYDAATNELAHVKAKLEENKE